jgi:hypothetical protein
VLGDGIIAESKNRHLWERWARGVGSSRAGKARVAGQVGGRGDTDVAGHGPATAVVIEGIVEIGVSVIVGLAQDGLGEQGRLVIAGSSNHGSLEFLRVVSLES